MAETIDLLLDAAESGMRLRGYHAVSFRDLADELGIKSSSVHYYFRQKEDLGLALIHRYSERFFAALDARVAGDAGFGERLRAFVGLYREALVSSDRICLCGMLGAESCGLPEPLGKAVAEFFSANVDWLLAGMAKSEPMKDRRRRARQIVATLQGAMILASTLKDHKVFDDAAAALTGAG